MPSEFVPSKVKKGAILSNFFATQSAKSPELTPLQLQEFRLRTSSQLQTTLDIDKLIGLFFGELKSIINLSGIEYSYHALEIQLQLGIQSKRTCKYELNADNEFFGIICFSYAHRLQEKHLEQIESLMDLLIYPLRNALKYRQAVKNALTDPLTGANNRTALESNLKREIEVCKRQQNNLCALMIDIDHFKHINDTFGHLCGDQVLQQCALIMMQQIRQSDMCFRYGGEEFLIILTNTNAQQAVNIAQRIRETIQNKKMHGTEQQNVTVSIGIAQYYLEMESKELIDSADRSMYRAKNNGRNQVCCNQYQHTQRQLIS